MANNKVLVTLFTYEQAIADRMSADGLRLQEIIRQLIREYGERKYPELGETPAYAKAQLIRATMKQKERSKAESGVDDTVITNEDYVTKILRGKIRGDMAEFRMPNGSSYFHEISNIRELTPDSEYIRLHIALLDRTYVYADSKQPTAEQYKLIFKGY